MDHIMRLLRAHTRDAVRRASWAKRSVTACAGQYSEAAWCAVELDKASDTQAGRRGGRAAGDGPAAPRCPDAGAFRLSTADFRGSVKQDAALSILAIRSWRVLAAYDTALCSLPCIFLRSSSRTLIQALAVTACWQVPCELWLTTPNLAWVVATNSSAAWCWSTVRL